MSKIKTPQIFLQIFVLALTLLVHGCAAIWEPAPNELAARSWSLKPPEGWMRLTTPTYEMLSRDGPYLQYIFIQEQPLQQGLRNSRQKIGPSMLPHEAAAVIIDTLKSDTRIRNFHLLKNSPATLGGKMGFRLIYTYTDDQGVQIKCDYYGVILPKTFFNIRYTAAQRHYFDKDADRFQQTLGSLRFKR
ncbi:MAG: hypothetical protein PVH87_14050 [Desulfobacteraceae bacterium]|jgi:hypothetical protein